jgi:hypothetical protein
MQQLQKTFKDIMYNTTNGNWFKSSISRLDFTNRLKKEADFKFCVLILPISIEFNRLILI